MGGGRGIPGLNKKKSTGVKGSDQNSDITVFSGENFSGNSQTFEVSNSQFKTNFDISFKEPVKSIIISGIAIIQHVIKDIYKETHGFYILSQAMPGARHFWRRGNILLSKISRLRTLGPLKELKTVWRITTL